MRSEIKPSYLVLCTGNSARSQMAHAILERELGDSVPVYSAGTEPAAAVHPMAIRAMAEVGRDISHRTPVDLGDYLDRLQVRTLVIVCDGAAKSCPATWPGVEERLLWPFEDPAAVTGSDEQVLDKFREVRDLIERKVQQHVAEL